MSTSPIWVSENLAEAALQIDELKDMIGIITAERDHWSHIAVNILSTVPSGDIIMASGTLADITKYFQDLHDERDEYKALVGGILSNVQVGGVVAVTGKLTEAVNNFKSIISERDALQAKLRELDGELEVMQPFDEIEHELRRLSTVEFERNEWKLKAETLEKERDSMKADYLDAARVLNGATDYEPSMLKPLANTAAKIIAERDQFKRMFDAAILCLEEIDDELGIPKGENGGALPILMAIREIVTERDALREQIAEWEKQTPIGLWSEANQAIDWVTSPVNLEHGDPLYARPIPQPAQSPIEQEKGE